MFHIKLFTGAEIVPSDWCFEKVSQFPSIVANKLVWFAILPVVDIETKGAGDGEGQVGDDGEHIHPGRPLKILEVFNQGI